MSIGTTIKKLRRERDITQEQLAEYLGISSKAISQWECDKTMPDIMQLPLLANIFNVTTDEILGVNIDQKEKRIDALCAEAKDLACDGFRQDEILLLRKGLLEYPNSYKIMKELSSALYIEYVHSDDQKSNRHKLEEALELGLKVINGCSDIDIKAEAIECTSYIYRELGDKKSAIRLAMTLPTISRGLLLWQLYEGKELANFLSKDINKEMSMQLLRMSSIPIICVDENHKNLYTLDEQLAIHRKIVDIYEILYEDGDFLEEAQRVYIAYFRMAEIYAVQKNDGMMFECLEKGIKHGIEFNDYEETAVHTSLLFRGLVAGGWVKDNPDDSHRMEMLEWLAEPQFDAYREMDRFGEIIKLIQA